MKLLPAERTTLGPLVPKRTTGPEPLMPLPIRLALTPGLWSKQLQFGVARQCAAQSDAFDH
jgi:hypothetical protein